MFCVHAVLLVLVLIVGLFQESEEVRSNSLDKELKIKQTELMMKVKEKSETEEVSNLCILLLRILVLFHSRVKHIFDCTYYAIPNTIV